MTHLHPSYRSTHPVEFNSWYPPVLDRRPRLCVPVVDRLPAFGEGDENDVWKNASVASPFHRPIETQRLLAPLHGMDVNDIAADPTRMGGLDSAHATKVKLIAWVQSPRICVLRVRFDCGETDMSRLDGADASADPTSRDYVSMLVNSDRAMDRVNEIGVTADGVIFARPYQQFVGAHATESLLHAQAATVLGDTEPTQGRPEESVPEDGSNKAFNKVQARVWKTDSGWSAELQIALNRFGQYNELYTVYPCNFHRHHPVRPVGSPAGINWRAGMAGFSWAPVRFLIEDFNKAGFLCVGNIDAAAYDRQIANIQDASARAHEQRKVDLAIQKADTAAGWRSQVDPNKLDTQWLPRALPGFEYVDRGFTLNNSRQLITLENGNTLVLAEDTAKLCLFTTQGAIDPVGHDLSKGAVTLVGEGGVLPDIQGPISHASMLRDGDELHVAFATNDKTYWCIATLGDLTKWDVRLLETGCDTRPYDIETVGNRVVLILADTQQQLLITTRDESPTVLPFPGRCPVLAKSQEGVNLAYEFNATIYYVKLDDALLPIGEPTIAAYAEGFHPAMVEYDGRPLITYQYLGVQKCDPDATLYIAERERCGSSIAYAHLTEQDTWQRGSVMDYEEVVVRKLDSTQYMLDMVNRPHKGRAYATMDENWRPTISIDANHIVRVAWQNTTRCHAFVAQFTGKAFARHEELAGPLSLPTSHTSLEKHPPAQSPLNHLLVAERRVVLDSQPTKAIDFDRTDEITFLDESVVQSRRGLSYCINPFERIVSQPILTLPNTGLGEGRDGISRPTVWINEQGVYCGIFLHCADHKQHTYGLSNDGIDWKVVDESTFLDQVGQQMRNLFNATASEGFTSMGARFSEAFFGLEDHLETDPARRFKKLVVEGHQTDRYAVRRVWYSHDGYEWTAGPEAHNNVHMNETHIPNLYDPWDIPERRFKLYGRTSSDQGRTLGMLWSGDMIHWHGDHEPTVREDPYARPFAAYNAPVREAFITLEGSASTTESEHYYCIPWLEAGRYMVLYANLQFDGHKSVRLAHSRDGYHFKRVGDQDIFPLASPGNFDSGSIDHPCFVDAGDELKLYYGGTGEKHGSLPYTGQHEIGVAAVRKNSWRYYTPSSRHHDVEAELITIPLPAGRDLYVNKQGDVKVEVLNAEGFSVDDVDPIEDGLRSPVTWGGKPLSALKAGDIKLRFILSNAASKLFGFTLSK